MLSKDKVNSWCDDNYLNLKGNFHSVVWMSVSVNKYSHFTISMDLNANKSKLVGVVN